MDRQGRPQKQGLGADGPHPVVGVEGPAANGLDVLESSPYAQIAFDFDLMILAANANHSAMTGVSRDAMIGRAIFDVFPPNPDAPDASAETPLRESVERVRLSGAADTLPAVKHDIERADVPGTYEERFWQLIHSPLRSTAGEVVGVLQTARDVTVEMGARHLEDARRRSAESGGKLQFWEADLSTGEVTGSAGIDTLFGFASHEPRTLETLVARVHEEDRPALVADLDDARELPVGTAFDTDYRIVRPDGSLRHVNALVEVVSQHGARRVAGVLIDTTAIHRREESLRRLVEEKQKLLADVNHRVKNSLQLVASLLRIEERASADPALSDKLGITAGRVAAITAIHASLYHYADMARVNISEHLRTFCNQLIDERRGKLRLELDDEPIYLGAERAVPLALLVNELTARALTHADGRTVTVSLRPQDHRLLLRIENAATSAPGKPGSLGSRLVEALLVQLDATLKQDPSDDAAACIEFDRA